MRLPTYLVWLTALWLAPVAAILLPCAPSAHAQAHPGGESEHDQQARTRFEQGREAYKDGRYRDAWAYFHEAYQLSGRPELLFNIGQTADRLGQDSDALRAFSMYIERLPNAENRRDVENRVRALRERVETTQKAAPSHPALAPNVAPVQPTPVQPAAAPSRPAPRSRRERVELQRTAAPAPSTAPAAEHAREPRRGLYLRAALGLGPRTDSFKFTNDNFDGLDAGLSGWGPALDIAAGWAVLPGFVVGGGLFLDWTSSPTLSVTDGSDTLDGTISHARLTSIGPFVDWYPKRATLGLHIEGGIGLGLLGYRGDWQGGRVDRSASGVTFFLGAGYEWRIAGAFAIGALLRVTGAALASDTETHGLFSPSLLVSFTWF